MTARSKKWIAGLAVLAALVAACGVALFLWHLWRAHGQGVSWGDVPTWLAFVVVLIGLPAALAQLNMQRIQLRDQQREGQQRQIFLEREQASHVNLTREYSDAVPESSAITARVWMAVVANDSQRPIRDVKCRIRPAAGENPPSEARIGELVPMPSAQGGRALNDLPSGDRVKLMRIASTYGFAFGVTADDHPMAQVTTRFTDDAGLYWQLDQDLHLQKLDDRHDW